MDELADALNTVQVIQPFWWSIWVVCRPEVVLISPVSTCFGYSMRSASNLVQLCRAFLVILDVWFGTPLEVCFCCCLLKGTENSACRQLSTYQCAATHRAVGIERWPKRADRKSQPTECIYLSFLRKIRYFFCCCFLPLNFFWPLMATGPDTS